MFNSNILFQVDIGGSQTFPADKKRGEAHRCAGHPRNLFQTQEKNHTHFSV